MKVVFLGRGEDAHYILKHLLKSDVDIRLIMTSHHFLQAKGGSEQFEQIAKSEDIPFIFDQANLSEETINQIRSIDADIGIALFWPYKIPEKVINTVKHGFLNLHGGLLPRYRGNACANWAILNGEDEMGITIHFMDPGKLDSGPILAQQTVPITPNTVVGDLMEATRNIGATQIVDIIKAYEDGSPPTPILQDDNSALRCYPRLPSDGMIDWHQSAEQINLHIRSLGPPYEYAYSYLEQQKLHIVRAQPLEKNELDQYCAVPGHVIERCSDRSINVATGNGILKIIEIKIDTDSDSIKPSSVVKSIRNKLGIDIEFQLTKFEERIKALEAKINRTKN